MVRTITFVIKIIPSPSLLRERLGGLGGRLCEGVLFDGKTEPLAKKRGARKGGSLLPRKLAPNPTQMHGTNTEIGGNHVLWNSLDDFGAIGY